MGRVELKVRYIFKSGVFFFMVLIIGDVFVYKSFEVIMFGYLFEFIVIKEKERSELKCKRKKEIVFGDRFVIV